MQYVHSEPAKGSGPRRGFQILRANLTALLVVVLSLVVHCWPVLGSPVSAADGVAGHALPPPAAEMRDLLLAAVRSGHIEDLRAALELNGVKPDFGAITGDDPFAAMKALSGDGQGREYLAALAEILDMPPAALPLGRDLENNLVFVWPYLAAKPLDHLSATEEVDLLRLVTPAKAKEMREKKRWLWWRLAIGADGTWQAFKKDE